MRICANKRCEKEFEPRIKRQIYCNEKCNDQASNDRNNELMKKRRAEARAKRDAESHKPAPAKPIDQMFNDLLRRRWG